MLAEVERPTADDARAKLDALRDTTVWRTIDVAASHHPDRDFLVGADDAGRIRRLTYGKLARRVRAFSAGLASIGVQRGDRVVLWMTNRIEWVVASFAIQRLGATTVPINTFLKPEEIRYLIVQSGARNIVMLDRFRALDMPAMLTEICPAFADARPGLLSSPDLPDLRNVVMLGRDGGTHPACHDFAALERAGGESVDSLAMADRIASTAVPTDLALVKYTSGSTGFPKGVMLEQGSMVANALLHSRRVGVQPAEVMFSMMPFFHGGGGIWGLMTVLVTGGTLVFTEAFTPALAVDLLLAEKPHFLFGVLISEIAEEAIARGVSFPTLRIAPLPNDDARRVMPNVTFSIEPFGLTETVGPASVTSPDDPKDKQANSCGRPLEGNEIRAVDPATGIDVPPGEVGEAWIRGNIMRGYWNKPDETARALPPDGWLRSEDLVTIDADGYVNFVGRLKLMLKVGGENVSIEEVENSVRRHDAVAACAAIGVRDPRKGEAVGLYVVRRPGREIDAGSLTAWLAPRLARFKMPREIRFLDALPVLANGKVDRVSLAHRARDDFPA